VGVLRAAGGDARQCDRILARDLRIANCGPPPPSGLDRVRRGRRCYRIVDRTERQAVEHPDFERIDRRYSRDAIFEGVKILPVGLAAKGEILFPCDGREPPPGRIMVSYKDETRTLEIEGGTGKILLSERDSASHAQGE
jgi:hypothetical protein